ncbi:MAG: ATP-binding protein [Propionicimonas sp.]
MSRGQPVAGWRLGTRLFLAQAAALVAIVVTAGIVAVVLGPPLFHAHLVEAGHPTDAAEIPHIEQAFADAGVLSLTIGLLVALAFALAVTWYLTRRIGRPLGTLTTAARRMATGDYDARVRVDGAGPELVTLAASFNQMAERLGNTEHTRRRLLADLAHELRTPVATLSAHLEGLADGITEWDGTTRRVLQHQTDRLARLARDLDEVSRAEEGRISLDPGPQTLSELVGHAVGQFRDRCAGKGVTLSAEATDAVVVVDPQRIAQILANLLGNALRHTPPGGRITVSAGRRGTEVSIAVTDTGDGLTREQLDHVFERFYRGAPAREADPAGSGIGLTIARAIAEAHGGGLAADSPGPGRGASFVLTLPQAGPPVSG